MTEKYDIAVVGSGPGGYVAAIRAAQLGKKTAVVEMADLGGVCLNWGCIPTKAMLKSAQVYHYATSAQSYGIDLEGTPVANAEKIVARSRAVAETMSKGVAELPQSMIVCGSGAIGSEFAYLYASLGVKVTVVEYLPNLMPLEDEEVSAAMERAFRKMRITVMTSTAVKSVTVSEEGCTVEVEGKKGAQTLSADVVLSAVGIKTNTENIGLETVGIQTVKDKIPVDEFYRTSVEGIYAIGDLVPSAALAHVASAEAICCVEKICGLNPEPVDYSTIPSCVYTSPEVASVGLTQRQAEQAGYKIKIGKFPFTASGKATAAGQRDGFVKLIFDEDSERLLGAHMVGMNVTEMIAEPTLAKKLGATAHILARTIHSHPTMNEAVMEAAEAATGAAIHL